MLSDICKLDDRDIPSDQPPSAPVNLNTLHASLLPQTHRATRMKVLIARDCGGSTRSSTSYYPGTEYLNTCK